LVTDSDRPSLNRCPAARLALRNTYGVTDGQGATTSEGTALAFVIFSAGPVTRSTAHTIDAQRFAIGAGLLVLCLMAACLAAGYQLARTRPAQASGESAAAQLDLDHPEARALIDRVGALSSRVTLLESEATTLARRLTAPPSSVTTRGPAPSHPAGDAETSGRSTDPSSAKALPSGGPFIPVEAGPRAGDVQRGLTRLESRMGRLEATLARLADMAVEHDLVNMAFPSRWPIREGPMSSGFGVRRDPFTGRLARHEGLDFPAPVGTPILASAGGRVVRAGYYGPYGYAVVIDHGNGLATLYGHASKLLVHRGELVLPRQPIAAVGSTGRSTGAHLHFEVMRHGIRVEPRDYLAHAASPIDAS
jgi:murein DD-endopeptidase MepM/ murein hydrolase activator NlpD